MLSPEDTEKLRKIIASDGPLKVLSNIRANTLKHIDNERVVFLLDVVDLIVSDAIKMQSPPPPPVVAADKLVDQPPEAISPVVSSIESFLTSKKITITQLPVPRIADATLDSIAGLMGSRHDIFKDLLHHVKRCMTTAGGFKINLKDRSPAEVSDICLLCSRLHQIAFFEDYHYFRTPNPAISVKTTNLPIAMNFFSGLWLERYITQVAHTLTPGAEIVANAKVTMANGNDFEFDLLIRHNSEIYWVEMKSGDYQRHIQKYSRIARQLSLPKNRSIMVLVESTPDTCKTLGDLFEMTVVPIQNISEEFQKIFATDG